MSLWNLVSCALLRCASSVSAMYIMGAAMRSSVETGQFSVSIQSKCNVIESLLAALLKGIR